MIANMPNFPTPQFEDNSLLCAHCGFRSNHVIDVVWFRRNIEDGEVFATSLGDSKYRDYDVTPQSERRDTAAIITKCENCGRASALYFSQHKGDTYVEHVALTRTHVTGSLSLGVV